MSVKIWGLAALLFASSLAHGSVSSTHDLRAAAEAAYDTKDYKESVRLYRQAFVLGEKDAVQYYNGACSASLSGDVDGAIALIREAIARGYRNLRSLETDPDLVRLRSDRRWATLIMELKAANPWLDIHAHLANSNLPANERYLRAKAALDLGMQVPNDQDSTFLQLYATVASLVGDYDTAERLYIQARGEDPVATGHIHARPANEFILAKTRDRKAVFFNESRGRAQTRAAILTLLAPLRGQGFKYLAMEAFLPSTKPDAAVSCPGTQLEDKELSSRGFPVAQTGYYAREPVDAELIRQAIALGYELVAYEATGADLSRQASREEAQAANLACRIKADPEARLLVIAGFGHISEDPDFPNVLGGMMAHRFTRMTGVDPLTIDTTSLLTPPAAAIEFSSAAGEAGSSEGFVLLDDTGDAFRNVRAAYDLSLLIRAPAHRNDDGASWLELGGLRRRVRMDPGPCQAIRPCLMEVRRVSEPATAIVSDGCVLAAGQAPACHVFVTPGAHRARYFDSEMRLLSEVVVDFAGPVSPE